MKHSLYFVIFFLTLQTLLLHSSSNPHALSYCEPQYAALQQEHEQLQLKFSAHQKLEQSLMGDIAVLQSDRDALREQCRDSVKEIHTLHKEKFELEKLLMRYYEYEKECKQQRQTIKDC